MMQDLFKILILLLIVSCSNNKKGFTITGETDRVGDAILLIITPEGDQIHDTTSIQNGEFQFKKTIEKEEWFRLKFHDGSSIDLLAKGGEKIQIDFQQQNLSIDGSDGSIKIMQLNEDHLNLILFQDSIVKYLQQERQNPDFETISAKSIEKFFEKLKLHKEILEKFIEENKDSKVSLIPLFQKLPNTSTPILNLDEDLKCYQKVLENLKLNFPNSSHIGPLEEQITIAMNDPLRHGNQAPDFTLPDLNGKLLSLSDLKGKVVLIDFWASWCGPCRRDNPKLVKLHEKYSGANFEILSVSLDGRTNQKDSRKAWTDAIKKDNLSNFIHVSELTGWNTKARDLYNFNSIPHTVLIDQEGKIIGKKLRGHDLEIKIKNALNNEREE
jgi:thiol-disulfide isomerase/thioredoxin